MAYCCADGNVGRRVELEGAESWAPLQGEAAPQAADDAGDSCVDKFMTPVNRVVEDWFVDAGVDVHVTAHQHVYERTTPVYRYQAFGNRSEPFPAGNPGDLFIDPGYPINVNNGCPGNVELQDVWMPRPSWSVGGRFNADGSGDSPASFFVQLAGTRARNVFKAWPC